MGGRKITGSPRSKLEEYWGRDTANRVFHEKKIVLVAHFDSIWWLRYEKAMAGYPKKFRTFVTKQVSGWCRCNSKLSLWEKVSTANVLNVDANMRTPSTSPDALTQAG
jgi:hypothetical protein